MEQHQGTKLDFRGQQIYAGVDTGMKSWKVCIMTEHIEHKTFSQPPRVDVLAKYLHRNFPGAEYHCVYEAGYSGFWIHDELRASGIDCIVVNPADVPTKGKEHTHKTNGVDARKLCRNLRSGELDAIYVPARRSLEDRSLIRTRYGFVRKQTRCKNQIKALLAFYGISLPEEIAASHWSRRYIRWLEQEMIFKRPSGDQTLKSLLEELLSLRQIIAHLTKQIRALAHEEPYSTSVQYLMTIHGISTLTAMTLLTELIDIHRFGTLDHLANYCGLVPGERSTGEEQTMTGISPRRNAMIRGLLMECAWVAVRKDPALLMAFNTLSARMPKNKAIVRIARKLLNRIRFVLKNQQPYQACIVQSPR
jgi:transposase